ncbi:MAG: GHKL domain-containing protein [Lachnospiraceae bacterium]|nr:GHKL domain-containing protein [Lachnospiraceae bacterium]
METRCNLLNESYNSLNEIYRNNAKLYHDLNNHLNLLYQLLQEEKVDEAQRYIKEIAEPILALSKKQWTGIDVADTVLNSKIQEMNERNIMPDINVEFPENSTILPNDLCTILSNLLDNAIEAVEKLDENRKIKLTMRRANFFLFIRVSNPCGQNRKFAVFPATTKENASLHGWGLRSVKDVVERYGGTMECVNENYEFIMNIMLPFDGKN